MSTAGRCGRLSPVIQGPSASKPCVLRHGHAGWHEAEGGMPSWGPTSSAPRALAARTMTGVRTARALLGVPGTGEVDHWATFRGRRVHLKNRGADAYMGRFGGGWERELGIQLGGRGFAGTIIINLWRGSIRIDPRPAPKAGA